MLLGDINRTGNVRKSKLQASKILTILISDRGKEATYSEGFNEANQTNKQSSIVIPAKSERFPIGGERVTCHGSKPTNYFGKHQLELSTRT